MNKVQIRQLAEKYFEGNTSFEEERLLREFLASSKEIEVELFPLKKQLELFNTSNRVSFDAQKLETEILSRIAREEPEIPTRKIAFQRWLVAASIILVVFTGVVLFKNKDSAIKDTYSDPKLAYVETQKALMLVSQKMNKGMDPLSNINKINTSTQQLKNLDKMDRSLEMLYLVSFINQSSNLKK
jgi:hypothetical protein